MINVQDSTSSSPGLNPSQGHCVVFLARHFTLTVPLSTQMYKWANLMLGGNPAMDWCPIQGGSRNTLSHFMLQELG